MAWIPRPGPHDGPDLATRLGRDGPKRLLALDGGGIRGLVTLGYLARMERMLRGRTGRPDLVLSDYFDLIGGTSTGAIIATCLALGLPVEDIAKLYVEFGSHAFAPRRSWFGPLGRILGAKFDEQPLTRLLQEGLEDRRLDSEDLRCGLMVVVKRADTGSVWPVVNVPTHKYFAANRHFPLWEVVSASASAPTFFRPRRLDDVGGGEPAVFVDGGVSMHNCPALQLLMVATLSGFGLRWPLGEEKLLLCSVGTGHFTLGAPVEKVEKYTNVHWLAMLTLQMIRDAAELNQTMLQWMSRSPTARGIDSQIETLGDDLLGDRPLCWYLRYDVDLDATGLRGVGIDVTEAEAERLRAMSEVANMADLERIGRAAADAQVHEDHFPPAFDL